MTAEEKHIEDVAALVERCREAHRWAYDTTIYFDDDDLALLGRLRADVLKWEAVLASLKDDALLRV